MVAATAQYIYPFKAGTVVTQNFGQFPGGYNPWGGHTGKDFAVPIGTPIYAACDGIIEFEGWVTGEYYENPWWFLAGDMTVVLNAGAGKPSFTYGHLNETLVSVGQRVKKGQIIAYSGNTGISSGPHCHFEVLPDGWNYQNGTYGRINPDSICVYWDGKEEAAAPTSPIPQGLLTKWAIDTSNFQGDVNVAAINPDFVLVRATEGAGVTDEWYPATVRKTRNAGKQLGHYHYAHPMHFSGNTPEAEARYFIDAVKPYYRPGDKIILDWENKQSQLGRGDWALAWMDQVVAELGADPDDVWFYTYLNILTQFDGGLAPYRAKYPNLWLAYYGNEQLTSWGDPKPAYGMPSIQPGWNLVGWQYTQYGRIPGHTGNIDLSIIYDGDDMPTADEIVHAFMVKPIGDAYNGENGKPKVTVSDLFIKMWQNDMPGVSEVRDAGNGFLVLEAVNALADEVSALAAPAPVPAPAPVLAEKYEIQVVKVEDKP